MRWIADRIQEELETAESSYGISQSQARAILLAPVALSLFYLLSFLLPATRDMAAWMQEENRPIELLTFVFMLAGGVLGSFLAWRAKVGGEKFLVYGFYSVFSIGLLFTAMEEVAWGQWFFGFDTPSAIERINVQGEFTLHNIQGLHGKTEFARVAFGLGGLFGVWLSYKDQFRKIAAPFVLTTWFLIISVHAIPDLYVEIFSVEGRFDLLVSRLAEFIEMLIGTSGFLYVWLNSRMLASERNVRRLPKRGD